MEVTFLYISLFSKIFGKRCAYSSTTALGNGTQLQEHLKLRKPNVLLIINNVLVFISFCLTKSIMFPIRFLQLITSVKTI